MHRADETLQWTSDAPARLRQTQNQTPDPVSEYRYNGLNWRISMQHDDDANGDLDASDLTYYFVYDECWRPVATFREDDSDPKEQFVYHAAGADGRGTASYIDDVVLRDKDADTDWDVQADGTLEERLYYCQNWRHDVVALIDASGGGAQVEHVRYEAYGVPTLILAGDVDASGKVDTSDTSQIQTWIDTATYDVRGDVDLDGDVDSTDKTTVQNSTATQGGRTNLSHAEYANRKGYAGYEFDDTITHESYHVRHRVLNSVLGLWGRRDPIGYQNGTGLYSYVRNGPVGAYDPTGTQAEPCVPGRNKGVVIARESDPFGQGAAFCQAICQADWDSPHDLGRTRCFQGKVYGCVCDIHGDFDSTSNGDPTARALQIHCVREHETEHTKQLDCTCGPQGTNCYSEPCAESQAYGAEFECIRNACGWGFSTGATDFCTGCVFPWSDCNVAMKSYLIDTINRFIGNTIRCNVPILSG